MNDTRGFIDEYYQRFISMAESFDKAPLIEIASVFEAVAERNGTIWVAGNGGSAAIADHTVCDTSKGTHVNGCKPLRCVSLAANGPMLTALGNDIGFDQVFKQQLVYYARPGDATLFVSSSGNSPNVVEACKYARSHNLTTIAFVGFSGGKLLELADLVVHIPIHNYGIVEDLHQSLMHVLTQYLYQKRKLSLTGADSGTH